MPDARLKRTRDAYRDPDPMHTAYGVREDDTIGPDRPDNHVIWNFKSHDLADADVTE